jgi:hypothetical protein
LRSHEKCPPAFISLNDTVQGRISKLRSDGTTGPRCCYGENPEERVMRSPVSSLISAIDQVARLAGAVVQRALRSHLFPVHCFDQPGLVEKELPRGYVFNGNSNIETHTLEVSVISYRVHRDGKAFMHERIFHRLPPLTRRS